ncbi:MAG: DUF2891 domain-containing protein [Casimicrobiaceae bacterium]
MTPLSLDAASAAQFADIALANVVREYPGKADHVLGGNADLLSPRVLHPAFYGSYDWHSCVHMHWLLVHVRRLHPGLPQRSAIDALLDRHLTPANISAECAYLRRPHAQSFERPYGWTWLLKLADELALSTDNDARRWAAQLAPLARAIVERYLGWLPKSDYPIRYGMHSNSAFGLLFALDFAKRAGEDTLANLCVDKARTWYGDDRDVPAAWEPSGFDFLSPALVEAELMRRVLPSAEFASWLSAFLPDMRERRPVQLFTPVNVSDRGDPHIVHLDGLNLSRAWCFRGIASALPERDPRAAVAREAAAVHLAAGLAGLDSADYLGSHWLASFAALALGG